MFDPEAVCPYRGAVCDEMQYKLGIKIINNLTSYQILMSYIYLYQFMINLSVHLSACRWLDGDVVCPKGETSCRMQHH